MLFLGGPLDGTWRALPDGSPTFRVMKPPPPLPFIGPFDEMPVTMALPETIDYSRAGRWAEGPSAPMVEVWTVGGVMPPVRAVRAVLDQPWADSSLATRAPAPRPPLRRQPLSETPVSVDAHTVSFSTMTAEAEAELAEWDAILHGRS